MPTPPGRVSPAPVRNTSTNSNNGPNAWTAEQQQEFLRALMTAPDNMPGRSTNKEPLADQAGGLGAEADGDIMGAMLNALAQMPGQGALPGLENKMGIPSMAGTDVNATTSRSIFVRLRPVIHLIVTWALLGFFALNMEPKAYAEQNSSIATTTVYGTLERWAQLARYVPKGSFAVQTVVGYKTPKTKVVC